MRAHRRDSFPHVRAGVKRPPRVRIPRRVKPGAYERHSELFHAHALSQVRRENAKMEEWEGTTGDNPMPGDTAYIPDFRTGSIHRVGAWTVPPDGPPAATASGARYFGSFHWISVRKFPTEASVVLSNEKLLDDRVRDRQMVLAKFGLQHETEDPSGFQALFSTVRGHMNATRLEVQLTSVLKSSGVNDPSVLRLLVESLRVGFIPDGDLQAAAAKARESLEK